MREIYDWTKWFTELARKIAEGGERYLVGKAKDDRVKWRDDGKVQPLLAYDDESIDPFSFVYSLAGRGIPQSRERVYPNIESVFEMDSRLPVDSDDVFTFPVPDAWDLLFHDKGKGNPELLWRLFRDAVNGAESVNAQDFSGALEIDQVTITKLTQALFLINPSEFLPYDDTTRSLGIHDLQDAVNWTQYKEELQRFRDAFPGCAFYEINLFADLWKKRDIRKEGAPIQYFHVSTQARGAGNGDYWRGFSQLDFEPNNWVFTGGPKSGVDWHKYEGSGGGSPTYPLRDPRPGDIMLVRTGQLQGRGIGIVRKNDYQDRLAGDSKIHVVWVNKREGELRGKTDRKGFNYARTGTRNAFRQAPAYARTFELLERLSGREEPMVTQGTSQNSGLAHPLNQILYGPPGTGKTYHTVDHALKIIDPGSVRESRESKVKRFREFKDSDSGQIEMVTFHQSYAYEDFIEGIRPVLGAETGDQIGYELRDGIFKQIAKKAEDERAKSDKPKRFVLIIDEINRGNIAKIFGELITLIEDSRRLGADDETTVKLPYSQESFGVPKNLYLIGTMNTADRSIQLLDTALRRRFTFVEMMPDPEHERISEDVDGVNCRKMLKAMNERITALLDREHQIGHTYLMGVNTMEKLSDVFRNKIFPLLQEYFFDDWSKIRAVLNDNGFVSEPTAVNLPPDPTPTDKDRMIYKRLPDDDDLGWEAPKEYQKIYPAGEAGDS